jgi:hypothetical protein
MLPTQIAPGWIVAACLAAALVLTLVLAAFLTPRHWWRRANARALALLVGGTVLFGALFMLAVGAWPRPAAPVALAATPEQSVAPRTYRVFDDLNLRAASGTRAARIAVVTKGSVVSTTGRVEGDWCEVTASVNGRSVTGWASSLWLRRGDEH